MWDGLGKGLRAGEMGLGGVSWVRGEAGVVLYERGPAQGGDMGWASGFSGVWVKDFKGAGAVVNNVRFG